MVATTERAPRGQLGDWLDAIPPEVTEAAEAYDKAHSKAQKIKGELNTAKDNLIEKMIETGCKRCPIRNGEKFLELQEREAVKYAKPKEKPGANSAESTGEGDIVTQHRVRGGRHVTKRTPARASVVANDAGAGMAMLALVDFGLPSKKCDAVSASVGPTVGHLEKAIREDAWWHRNIKGIGKEWVDRVIDALTAFRKSYPVPSEDEPEPEGDAGTVLDPAVAGAE